MQGKGTYFTYLLTYWACINFFFPARVEEQAGALDGRFYKAWIFFQLFIYVFSKSKNDGTIWNGMA
jgi:hypothetical protein